MNFNNIVPARPRMPTVTRQLFNSNLFCVTLTRAGLIVQNHRTGRGVNLPVSHPQHLEYLIAFETAIDVDESHALCRALM